MYASWRYPDVFAHAGSMSGTFGWGGWSSDGMTVMDLVTATPPKGVAFYLDSGGGPGSGCPGASSDDYCDTIAMTDTLRSLGWKDGTDLTYVWAPDAAHNEYEWSLRFPALLDEWY